MKKLKLIMLFCIGALFMASKVFSQANPYINVLPSNSGIVSVGATIDIIVTIGNTGPVSTIGVGRIRPNITIPASVTFLPNAQQTGLPTGWTIVANSGSQLRVCNATDAIPVNGVRTIILKVQGVTIAPPTAFSGQIAGGNGSCGNGALPSGNSTTDDAASSSIEVVAASASISATVIPNNCNGQQNAQINATQIGLSGTLTWSLNPTVGANLANGTFQNLPGGTYTVSVSDGSATLSTVVTLTDVNPLKTGTESVTICASSLPYSWNGQTLNAAGTATFTTPSLMTGCDSTTTLTLTVNPLKTGTASVTICANQLPYSWNGLSITAAGTATFTTPSLMTGCDSTTTLNLTVNPLKTGTASATICASALPYLWNGQTLNAAGTAIFTTPSLMTSCDSTTTLTLNINPLISVAENFAILPAAFPFVWNGYTLTAAGTATFTTPSLLTGCDSTTTLNLSINTSGITFSSSLSVDGNSVTTALCNGGLVDLTIIPDGGIFPYTYSIDGTNFQTSNIFVGLSAGNYTVSVLDGVDSLFSSAVAIGQPAAINIGVTVTNVNCKGYSTGSATINVSGGTGAYIVLFDGQSISNNDVVSGLAAGTYEVQVLDENFCLASVNLTITEPSNIISATVTGTNNTCSNSNDATATVAVTNGVGNLSYAWSTIPVQTTAMAISLAANTYDVLVTDANGCSTNASVSLSEPGILGGAYATTNVVCNGAMTGAVIFEATGGTTPYNYAWSNGATSKDLSGVAAGNYTVAVTDNNGCITNVSITITEPTGFQVSANVVDIICNTSALGNITPTVIGGGGAYVFTISPSFPPNQYIAGTYTVSATNNSGCSKTTVVNVSNSSSAPSAIYSNGNGNCGVNPTTVSITYCTPLIGSSWYNFVDSSTNNIILSINPNGNNLGEVTATLINTQLNAVNTNTDLSGFIWNYMNKVWTIKSDSVPTSPVLIRFYYSTTEFNNLASAANCANCTGTDLIVSEVNIPNEDCNAANNTNGILNLYWYKNPLNTAAELAHVQSGEVGNPPVNMRYANVNAGVGATLSNMNAYGGNYIQVSADGFSEWRLHLPNAAPLSLDLLFKGSKVGNTSLLEWTSTKEVNVATYNLTRSANGNNYETIYAAPTKAVNGNSDATLNYSFTDTKPLPGHNYYRIEQVKMDGTKELTNVVDLFYGIGANIIVYPNPTTSEINIDVTVEKTTNATIRITDITGRVIKQVETEFIKGANTRTIDLSEVADGMYTISVRNHGVLNYSQKIRKN